MLAHSPPLPLVVDYLNLIHEDLAAEDEEGIILALKQRDRVSRVRLRMSVRSLQNLIEAMNGEYPILEYLIIRHRVSAIGKISTFPESFQAPHLRHLTLECFTLPIGSRLLTTAVGLVTLYLIMRYPFTYFPPNTLFHWISSMPQLEALVIDVSSAVPVPNREVQRQLAHTPIITPTTLPNLRHLRFHGVPSYLEELARWTTAPRLEKIEIYFYRLALPFPRLLHFINTVENIRFQSVKLEFCSTQINVRAYPPEEVEMYGLFMTFNCYWHLDGQAPFMVQISNLLGQMFSTVKHLTLESKTYRRPSEEHDEAVRVEWHKVLRSFSNVKTLRVAKELVKEISRCLPLEDDGELSLELLPELRELTYSGSDNARDAFTSFVDARRNAGRPITLVHSSNPTLFGPVLRSLHRSHQRAGKRRE